MKPIAIDKALLITGHSYLWSSVLPGGWIHWLD
jgi:hypothetical protein